MVSLLFPSGGAFSIDGVHSDTWRMYMQSYDYALIPGLRVRLQSIPGRSGKRGKGAEIDSRIVRLSLVSVQANAPQIGNVSAVERSAMHDRLHAFAAAVDPATGPHKLILLDDYPAWFLWVHTAAETPITPNLIIGTFQMQFEAADPFFYSTTARNVAPTSVANAGALNLVNNGNQPTPGVFTVTATPAAITGPLTLTLGGVGVTYGANLALNDVLVIDTDKLTVTKNGISDIANWSGDFPLIPVGASVPLTYSCPAGGFASLSVQYTERNL